MTSRICDCCNPPKVFKNRFDAFYHKNKDKVKERRMSKSKHDESFLGKSFAEVKRLQDEGQMRSNKIKEYVSCLPDAISHKDHVFEKKIDSLLEEKEREKKSVESDIKAYKLLKAWAKEPISLVRSSSNGSASSVEEKTMKSTILSLFNPFASSSKKRKR